MARADLACASVLTPDEPPNPRRCRRQRRAGARRRRGDGSGTIHAWPNFRISRMIGSRARPLSVNSYSTRGGDSGVAPPQHNAVLLEHVEPLRERARADPGTRVLELLEAPRAFREVVENQRRPLRCDDLRSRSDGTRLVMMLFIVRFIAPECIPWIGLPLSNLKRHARRAIPAPSGPSHALPRLPRQSATDRGGRHR